MVEFINKIMIDREKCMACMSCVLACMVEQNKKQGQGNTIYQLDLSSPESNAMNHIEVDDKGVSASIICRHCREPECVFTCMSGAMSRDEETGLVNYNKDQCAACYMCVMSCPNGVLKPNKKDNTLIMKCDLCQEEEFPKCVEHCPTGAIYLKEVPVE